MLVASYAETPIGVSKWLVKKVGMRKVGRRYFKIIPYLKARFFACGILYPSHLLSLAITNSDRWFAVPTGHGCMANYQHQMPNGISLPHNQSIFMMFFIINLTIFLIYLQDEKVQEYNFLKELPMTLLLQRIQSTWNI